MHRIWNFALQKRYIEVQHFSFGKAWWREVEWNMVHVRDGGKDTGKEVFFPRALLSARSWGSMWNGNLNSRIFNLCMLGESDRLHITAACPPPPPRKKNVTFNILHWIGIMTCQRLKHDTFETWNRQKLVRITFENVRYSAHSLQVYDTFTAQNGYAFSHLWNAT
jgi:hypothetical protein